MGPVIVTGCFPALYENRYGPFLMRGSDAMTSCAADDNGTRCSRALPSRPFILDAGMVMTLPSTSGHDICAASFSRNPVSSSMR
jgi:hypothetical protein